MFEIALSLYEDIGDQYSLSRGLFYYAQFLASEGQHDKAIATLTDHAAATQQAINELGG